MSKIQLPGLKDILEGGIKGIGDTAANIIGKLKADPTKVVEVEADLEKLRIQSSLEVERISIQAEEVANERLKIELEREKNILADTANARDMNRGIQESDKASWLAKNVGYMLDIFLGALWGTITIIILLKAFKLVGAQIDMSAILGIHGTVTAVFMLSMNFHRGTSIGSKNNGDVVRKIASNK